MKRFLILTLCAAMSLSCFMAGCTDKPDEPVTSDATDGETTQSVTEAEESETAYGTADDTTEEATTEEVAGPAEPAVTIWPVKAMTFNNKNIQSISIHASEDICEQYAARELQKYLEKMSIVVKEDGDFPITLQIDPALGDDSYRVETGSSIEDGMAITGGNGRGCYDAPLKAADRARYVAVEETVDQWWDKAEEKAGDRLAYVQRSRLQWRYIKLMYAPNEEEAKKFVEDVTAAGIYWREGVKSLPEGVSMSGPIHLWMDNPFT